MLILHIDSSSTTRTILHFISEWSQRAIHQSPECVQMFEEGHQVLLGIAALGHHQQEVLRALGEQGRGRLHLGWTEVAADQGHQLPAVLHQPRPNVTSLIMYFTYPQMIKM